MARGPALPFAAALLFAGIAATTSSNATSFVLPHVRGVRFYKVTEANIHQTICVPGWTRTIRPPESYTSRLKREQIAQWHLSGSSRDYEEDHLISLEVGGAPRSPRNLWPQPWRQARRDDDGIEARLHREVCDGSMDLRAAQRAEVAYKLKSG
jgi:hypothetical protein